MWGRANCQEMSGTTASKSINLQRPAMVGFFLQMRRWKVKCIPEWLTKGNAAGGMHFQVHASFQWGGFTLTVHQRVIHYEEPLIKINSHEQESTIHHHQNAINKAQNLRRLGFLILKSSPRNPVHKIRSPKSGPQNSVPEIRSPKSGPRNLVPETWSPKSGPQKPGPWKRKVMSSEDTRNPVHKLRSPKSGPQNSVPEIRSPKSGPRNLVPEPWSPKSGPQKPGPWKRKVMSSEDRK